MFDESRNGERGLSAEWAFYTYLQFFTIHEKNCICKGRGQLKKKRFLSGIARIMGGAGLPMPEFFGPLFRSAFLVNKKSLFLQKCQRIELLTVF